MERRRDQGESSREEGTSRAPGFTLRKMDELLNAFAGLGTSSHEEMAKKFAEIMKTSEDIATFFLEASGWNVETALNSYLSSVGDQSNLVVNIGEVPQASVQIIDQNNVLSGPIYCNQQFQLQWILTNTGTCPWPQNATLLHTEGPQLGGPKGAQIGSVPVGQMLNQTLTLTGPSQPGQFASTWRLKYDGGYFGDPVWIITQVVAAPPELAAQQQQMQQMQQQQIQQQQMQQQQMQQMQQLHQMQQQIDQSMGGGNNFGNDFVGIGNLGGALPQSDGGGGDDDAMDEDL